MNERRATQASLFGGSRSTSLFFVTTQRNLMSFLGAGMLLPSGAQFRYKVDSREGYGGAIPFWKAGLPLSDDYSEMLRDERTVIIECHIDDVMKYGGRFIIREDERLLAVNCPIPLLSVTAFYMTSKEIIDDFVMRVPNDVVLDSATIMVIPQISYFDSEAIVELEVVEVIAPQMTFIDSIGGGVRALLRFIPDELADYHYIRDLLNTCLRAYGLTYLKTKTISSDDTASKLTDSDKIIFLALIPILADIRVEDGFDPLIVLEQLASEITVRQVGYDEGIGQWVDYVRKAVGAEVEVPVLADERDIFKRAVLLFLLRPNLDRLENSRSSSIAPGPTVLSIAALFAGFANGLTRMGPEYKGSYREFNRFTKSLLDALWCKAELVLNVIHQTDDDYGASEVYEVNKEILFTRNIKQNVVLARVLNQAKSTGYDLHYDYDNHELYYEFDMGRDRRQIVYIELISPLAPGFDVIRFVSPCLDLSSKNLRSLKKDVAIDFLKRNCEDSMYCAFAYSERRKAIVAEAMQIVRTMDDDEFVTLLKYVSKVADEYERDVLGRDQY